MKRSFRESRESRESIIGRAHKKAVEKLSEFRPKEGDDDFVDIYGEENVANDVAYVQRMEETFSGERDRFQQHAEVFEAIFFDQVELAEWLGPNITTTPTAKYDDIANGVDCIADIQQGLGNVHAGIAFDVTEGVTNLEKKLSRVRKEINEGNLAQVKYFQSEDGSFVGTLKNIPRLIVAIDRKIVDDLAEKWMNGKNNELANHFVQRMILDQILTQLDQFQLYAEQIGQEKIVRILEKYKMLFKQVQLQKNQQANISSIDVDTMLKSEVYQEFMYLIKHFVE
ncbi:MAG: hypothetical protein GW775_01115 [Candidatus Magasanikbacteria bacterium]|uniref:Uncharacterized protein n=1 Tax=Candidatus Magasanikbacteria bacterium CG10_big_fil_rev_8_21_14_0_10_38_6 TaxID=1974647 RepID=A0A2M6P0L2_9BACT|nr:hypothetical protein [Candidatus Magasanikbacteria bacterium]PIR77218.1 MAG: hypothetical protein COU30_03680 [Candidatus Magasanikbacteria bacterium CG10_big_fil_rev_8_21_14_0_10_38_6]